MSITSDILRGNTDTIILARLISRDSYGYEINKSICRLSEGCFELKEATLYTTFKRLEEQGYISSYWGNENNGARRKYYSITPLGKSYYNTLVSQWEKSKNIISKLILSEEDSEK